MFKRSHEANVVGTCPDEIKGHRVPLGAIRHRSNEKIDMQIYAQILVILLSRSAALATAVRFPTSSPCILLSSTLPYSISPIRSSFARFSYAFSLSPCRGRFHSFHVKRSFVSAGEFHPHHPSRICDMQKSEKTDTREVLKLG